MAAIDPAILDIRNMRDDKKALRMIIDDFEESRHAKASREKDWERYYWQWRGKLRITGKYPLLSRSVLPLSHAHIETMVPFLVDALYDKRHFISGIGQEPQDATNAVLIGKYTNYQFTYLMKFIFPLVDAVRASLIFGTSWIKTSMTTQAQIFLEDLKPEEMRNVRGQMIKTAGTWRRIIYNGPRATYESPFSVFPDHANHEVDDMRYLIHKYDMPESTLFSQAFDSKGEPLLKNLELIANTKHPDPGRSEEKGGLEAAHSTTGPGHGSESFTTTQRDSRVKDRMAEVIDWWSPHWTGKIINREVLVFNKPNPIAQIPFTKLVPVRDPGFLYGFGVCESMNSLQNVINIMHNQRIDIVNLLMNPQWKVRRGASINTKQHISRPGAVIKVNHPDDVMPLIAQDTTPNIVAHIKDLISISEMTTGVMDFFRGEQPEERLSGAGINLIQKASARRFKLQIEGYHQNLIDIVGKVHFLNQKFIDPDDGRVARVIGIDGAIDFTGEITGKMFRETFIDFRPMGKASGGNPEVMATILQQLDQQWEARLTSGQRKRLMQTIVDLLDVPNLVDFLNEEEQIEEAQAGGPPDVQQLLRQAGGGGGPGGLVGPQGAPLDVVNSLPSRTNPGGNNLIRIRT